MTKKAARNSAVEWIRILAIVLIVITHAVPDALPGFSYDNTSPTTDLNFFFIGFLSGFGLIGDVLFLVCSCWYLADSGKASVKKIVSMILTVFIVSILWMAVILCLGYKLDAGTIVKQIFPTICQNNWFITYYLVFYAVHPLLNALVRKLDKKGLGILAGILFVHCFILMWITHTQLGVNKLLVFVTIYFAVAWIKKYGGSFTTSKKANIAVCVGSIVLYIILKTALNYIGAMTGSLQGVMLQYVHIYNPIIFAFAVSLINLANMKNYVKKPVNYVASLSMLVYIIHRNNLFAELIQPRYYSWAIENFGINSLTGWIMVLAVIFFAGSVLLGTAYRFTIERAVNLAGSKAQQLFDCALASRRNKHPKPALEKQAAEDSGADLTSGAPDAAPDAVDKAVQDTDCNCDEGGA